MLQMDASQRRYIYSDWAVLAGEFRLVSVEVSLSPQVCSNT